MKLFDIFENEFDNQEMTLDHLFRIQQARCQEFWVYLKVLSKKYNVSLPQWVSSSSSLRSSSLWLSSLSLSLSWPQQENEKYQIKYDRMVAAKKAYEDAGGTYK